MKEENTKERDEKKIKKSPKPEEELPFCTTAPSAEHLRGSDDDKPCDDGRAGDS